MSRRRGSRRTITQWIFIGLSLIVVLSMVLGYALEPLARSRQATPALPPVGTPTQPPPTSTPTATIAAPAPSPAPRPTP